MFSCRACLIDDPQRCVSYAQTCGDLEHDRASAQVAAKDALCDTLPADVLARRPTPPGFKPNPYLKNACYEWPDDTFTLDCTPVTKTCSSVPIH